MLGEGGGGDNYGRIIWGPLWKTIFVIIPTPGIIGFAGGSLHCAGVAKVWRGLTFQGLGKQRAHETGV